MKTETKPVGGLDTLFMDATLMERRDGRKKKKVTWLVVFTRWLSSQSHDKRIRPALETKEKFSSLFFSLLDGKSRKEEESERAERISPAGWVFDTSVATHKGLIGSPFPSRLLSSRTRDKRYRRHHRASQSVAYVSFLPIDRLGDFPIETLSPFEGNRNRFVPITRTISLYLKETIMADEIDGHYIHTMTILTK